MNFKSLKDLTIHFDSDLSVLTGVNNCGKTTIIEAIALWVECFEKLSNQAKRSVRGKYDQGDYILGPSTNRYFDFAEINSVRSPNFEDIFHNRDVKHPIKLGALLSDEYANTELLIEFSIGNSTNSRYVIKLENEATFDYKAFNKFFNQWPVPIASYFSSPMANIEQQEDFVTGPVLQDKLRQRRSFEIVRNRLYKLYHTTFFAQFQKDLSYILFGSTVSARLVFISRSDVNHDTRVMMNYTIGKENVEKDIALLGSGSLQAIEILLDLYNDVNDKRDLNIILLDEPDSHIHRNIQERLFQILNSKRNNNQVVITTHNETMIRTVPMQHLFHVDGRQTGDVYSLKTDELKKLKEPHFIGPYPSELTPIVASLSNNTTGLDFISAIEAEKIFFVEGDDDARLLYRLFRQKASNSSRKVMFWVLGGVNKMMGKIDGYYNVFKDIRNGQSLWDKASIVFDQDRMMDSHKLSLTNTLQNGKYGIKTYAANLYTQESILLTEPNKLTMLLLQLYDIAEEEKDNLLEALNDSCDRHLKTIRDRYWCGSNRIEVVKQYEGQYIKPLTESLKVKIKPIGELELESQLDEYYQSQPIWKLATKEDVVEVINEAIQTIGINRQFAESDFYALLDYVDPSTMFAVWMEEQDFLSL